MRQYMPEYLGKLIEPNNPDKMIDFFNNKYDAFGKLYDICKDESKNISDISLVKNKDSDMFSMKISASDDVVKRLSESCKDTSIKVSGNIFSTK